MPRSQVANVTTLDFGASAGPALGTAATASATLSTAVDGNTVTLSDGTTTVIFEFDNNVTVTPGNVLVDLGANDTAAAANLAAAIIASALLMTATSALGVVTVTAVTAEYSETLGNAYTIAKVGAPITVVAFSGGIDGDDAARVVQFRVKPNQGGKLDLKFENANGDNDMSVTVQVATTPTGLTPTAANGGWATTSVANNLAAVSAVTVQRRTSKEATILIRRGEDLYVRVLATGRCRGQLQVRGDHILEPVVL